MGTGSSCVAWKRGLSKSRRLAARSSGGAWSSAVLPSKPLPEDAPAARFQSELDGDQVPRHPDLVQADTLDTGDLGVEPRVMVPEEADARPHASRLAPSRPAPRPR